MDQLVPTKCMNLVSFQFCMFHGGCKADHLTVPVDPACQFISPFKRVSKERLEHLDHVFIGMVVIIPENHVVTWLLLGPLLLLNVAYRLLNDSAFFLL